MMTPTTTVRTYCTLCGVGCPSVITIDSGRVVRLEADREHPGDGAAYYTLGVYPVPSPDVERSGCIVLWGSNPPATLLSLGTRIAAARQRGTRLVVVDPRRVGLANRADLLLQVRPGTDGALALALIGELIEHRLYDDAFVREWTNAPLLVRRDTGRLMRAADVAALATAPGEFVAVTTEGRPVTYDPRTGYGVPVASLALVAEADIDLVAGHRLRW